MAPAMDLSQGTQPKVMIAPRRLNLRRAASYQGEKVPSSSTSSRFNFNHLMFPSPPPSPGLPALIPRPRKPTSAPRPSRVLRSLVWVAALAILILLARTIIQGEDGIPVVRWTFEDGAKYEMVKRNELPEFPTPIIISDRQGKSRWTVSIPPNLPFPLSTDEYASICVKCREVAAHVRESHGQSLSQQTPLGYYTNDPYFIDVRDSEKKGIVPGIEDRVLITATEEQEKQLIGQKQAGLVDLETCKTSLTFVLETNDAGLGPTLMMLWTAYGLAQKEKRAFFIDDSRWAYGSYIEMFKSSPVQDCKPPSSYQMLPCPRNAKHLVVSAATAQDTFGDSFMKEYENGKRSDINRERQIYDLARVGYEALFHLNQDDHIYVGNRVKELRAKASVPQGNYNDGTIIGVHVRQGDVHPLEYQYNGAYIPLDQYSLKYTELIEDRHNSSTPLGGEDIVAKQYSFMVVASDNPDVYEADEFKNSPRAQEKIKLAGKPDNDNSKPDRTTMHKFVDESFGWEGGFFASMFWNLGRSTQHNIDATNSDTKEEPAPPSADAMRLRGLMGRAYTMDLAVLGEASDAVICTMSAMGCRLLAVMMGWDRAMAHENWNNIDGNFLWTGITLS